LPQFSYIPLILQLSGKPEDLVSLDYYMRKTFFKTASLMANSCKAIALLAGQGEAVSQQAWEYGRHLGLAFQVRDLAAKHYQITNHSMYPHEGGVITVERSVADEPPRVVTAGISSRRGCPSTTDCMTLYYPIE